MNKLFAKPHPFIFDYRSIIIPGVLTILIIVLLAPLSFHGLELPRRISMALLFGGLVSLTIGTVVPSIKWGFPKFTEEDNWSVGKEIILYLLVVATIILVIFSTISLIGLTNNDNGGQVLIQTILITIAMSLFPIMVLVLFEQFNYQKKQLIRAAELNQTLHSENHRLKVERVNLSSKQTLKLSAENGNIELQMSTSELICLRSDHNYVEVFYFWEGRCTKKLLRNSLKNLEEILPENRFLRCHNSFIVNGEHIVEVKGNARNLELLMKGLPQKIPVSRSKAKLVTEFINALA